MPTLNLNLAGLGGYLNGMAQKAAHIDLSTPFKVTSVLLTSATKQNFENQATPDGTRWAPLKNPPRRRRGGKILRDTDVMMASFGRQAGHVEQVDRTSMVWGSNLDRAFWHQHGTRRMVARPMIAAASSSSPPT